MAANLDYEISFHLYSLFKLTRTFTAKTIGRNLGIVCRIFRNSDLHTVPCMMQIVLPSRNFGKDNDPLEAPFLKPIRAILETAVLTFFAKDILRR